jgi:hypothetical protein
MAKIKSLQITIFSFFWKKNSQSCENWPPRPSKKTHWGTRGRKKHRASSHSQQARQEVARTRIMREIEEDLVMEKNPRPLDVDAVALLKSYVSYL